MVVSILILQILVVSLLVLKRGLEPRGFRIAAFYGCLCFFRSLLRIVFLGRFFKSEFGFEPLTFESSWGSSLSPVFFIVLYMFITLFFVVLGFFLNLGLVSNPWLSIPSGSTSASKPAFEDSFSKPEGQPSKVLEP